MGVTQHAFRAGLTDAQVAPPAGLVRPDGTGAGARFDVYRNNVAVSLTEALETGFPAVRGLVGDAFFRAMAAVFLRTYPPDSPVLMWWGGRLPDFLAGFAPAQGLPYLPDVARLEFALRDSYHAADATPTDMAGFAALTPEALARARIRLVPSVRLVRSRWPVLELWRTGLGSPAPTARTGQNVLVTRPGFDPAPEVLPTGGGLFLARLIDRATLAEATEAATGAVPDFDPAPVLSRLLTAHAILSIEPGGPT
jgi:hypothetical protein